jgi:hypothetical protein
MTVKELFENEELMESIVEDIEDIPEDSEVTYEVWALGCDDCGNCAEDEFLLGEFSDPSQAVAFASSVTMDILKSRGPAEFGSNILPEGTTYFSIEVETVVEDPEDEDEGTMNIGTIYSRDLWIDGPEATTDPIVELTGKDYELTNDGELKISCELLKNFNKNDYVSVIFVEESRSWPMPYKIISKVEYADGDYYHLEFIG